MVEAVTQAPRTRMFGRLTAALRAVCMTLQSGIWSQLKLDCCLRQDLDAGIAPTDNSERLALLTCLHTVERTGHHTAVPPLFRGLAQFNGSGRLMSSTAGRVRRFLEP